MKNKFDQLLSIAAVMIVITAALFTALQNLKLAQQRFAQHNFLNDTPAQWDSRIAPLREKLPQFGVIGYISDRDIHEDDVYNTFQETLEYAWTQYALAPLILVEHPDENLVIGNLKKALNQADLDRFGLIQVDDFGNNLFLYQKRVVK